MHEETAGIGRNPSLAPVQLISSPKIRLGRLTIDPPLRRVVHADGREEHLEPRVMQVLVAFARAPGAVLSRDDLIACCWEGRVVGEDAVNRVTSRLRRLSQEIGEGSFRLETLTKVGFRLIVTATPGPAGGSAIQSESPAAPPPKEPVGGGKMGSLEQVSPAPAPWRKWFVLSPSVFRGPSRALTGGVIAAAVVVALILALLVGAIAGRPSPKNGLVPELRLQTIDSLGADGAPAIAQALRVELAAAFGRSSDLRLFTEDATGQPNPSAFQLSGSVQAVGQAMRSTFTLRSGEYGKVVWSGVVDRPIAEALAAPREIASQVSFTVRCILYGATDYPGKLPQAAISDYARFCEEFGSSESGDAISRGAEDLRRAVAQAPDFADGWANLALEIAMNVAYPQGRWYVGTRAEAEAAAARALQLDPTNSVAHVAKAFLTPRQNYAEREDELRLAVKGPDRFGDANSSYGRFLLDVGRTKDAATIAEQGFDIDPTGEPLMRLIQALYMMDHVPEADALIARANASWGDGPKSWIESPKLVLYELWAAAWDGRHQAALESLRTGRYDAAVRTVGPYAGAAAPIADAEVFKALDSGSAVDRAQAIASLTRLTADPRPLDPFVPVALAALGQNRPALAAEERLGKEWNMSLNYLLFTPPFAKARRSPQFTALADRLGLLRYWRMPGRAPDFCTDNDPPPLCRGLR